MPRGISRYDEAKLQSRLWTPDILGASLVCWYDADDLSTIAVSTGVSEWRDKSGNGRNLSQSTGSQQPALNIGDFNGRNSISFTKASSQSLALTNFPTTGLTGGLGVHFAAKWQSIAGTASGDIQVLMELQSSFVIQDRTDVLNDPFQVAHLPTGGNGALGAAGLGDNQWKIVGGVMTTGTDKIFENGQERVSGTNIASFTTNANLRVGMNSSSVRHYNGSFSEIIITSDLSDYTRQRIEGYMAHKFGLFQVLWSDHPFLARPPLIGD